jgi:tellurite resistance protein TerC
MEFFIVDFLGTPIWMWATFLALVLGLLALDLGLMGHREIGVRQSLKLSAGYISLGLAFSVFVGWQLGWPAATDYVTAFVVEKTLALDNIFVIALIFASLGIPARQQHRVLFWGVLGVIVLRGLMIGLGAALVAEYHWVLYIFAAFLILTGIKLLFSDDHADPADGWLMRSVRRVLPVTDKLEGEKFFLRKGAKWFVTPLFLALVMVELTDLIFAVDSVPAVFAITTDTFVVYTSNIFAILGLRALYVALASVMHRFAYLKYALAALLVFIGSKIFIADFSGLGKFPPVLSLGITFAILGAGIGLSLWKTRNDSKALH